MKDQQLSVNVKKYRSAAVLSMALGMSLLQSHSVLAQEAPVQDETIDVLQSLEEQSEDIEETTDSLSDKEDTEGLDNTNSFEENNFKVQLRETVEEDNTVYETLNLISNASLESQDYVSSKPTPIKTRSGDTASNITDYDGNRVIQTKPQSANDFVFYELKTQPGVVYQATADIFVVTPENETPSGAFFTVKEIGANGAQKTLPGGMSVAQMTDSYGKWAKQTIQFTAESDRTYVGLVKWHNNNQDSATLATQVYMDNLKVSDQSVYREIWREDFNKQELNQEIWGYELGNIRGNEQQHYSSSSENVRIEDGKLILEVTNRPEEDQYRNTEKHGNHARLVKYNSGSVRTHGKQDFLYGRIEARLKLPKGQGIFPAFWTLGSDFHLDGRINPEHGYGWPASGEIDIMEIIGQESGAGNRIAYGTPHFYYEQGDSDKDGNAGSGYSGNVRIKEDFYDDFHVFGINWSPDRIEWYVDDVIYNTHVFDNSSRSQALKMAISRPQYIQLNVAAGGNWPGNAGDNLAGQRMEVDWVRWLQNDVQREAMADYYATHPIISGVADHTMIQGETVDLLSGIEISEHDSVNYRLDYSIDDEYQFVNGGVEGGRNEVTNRVASHQEANKLSELPAGVYNVYYSTVPEEDDYNGHSRPKYKIARQQSHLVVLPERLGAKEGQLLSEIVLPEGWTWENETERLYADDLYPAYYRNPNDTTVSQENRRVYRVLLDANVLMLEKSKEISDTAQDNSTAEKEASQEVLLEGLNLVSNPSLEPHDYVSNKPNPMKHLSSELSDYRIQKEDGNHVLASRPQTHNDFVYYAVKTKPGSTYKVQANILIDGATENTATGAFFAAKVIDAQGNQRTLGNEKTTQDMIHSIGQWHPQSLEFVAESDTTYVGIVKWSDNSEDAATKQTRIYLDDLKVVEDVFYQEIWRDDFDGERLNPDTWGYELGNMRGNEQQHYSSSSDNVRVEDGKLILEVTNRPEEDQYRNTEKHGERARLIKYNSGSIRSGGRQDFLYGRIEAKMKLPKGQGIFPAFWTLGSDFHMGGRIQPGQGYGWPAAGEIDIMEIIGQEDGPRNKILHGTPHFYYENGNADFDGNPGSGYSGNVRITEDFYDQYHVFGVNWSPDRIEWYLDDVVYNTLVYDETERSQAMKMAFSRPQFIQFNVATGGNWAGDAGDNLAGQKMEVEWVRWLQSDEQREAMEAYYRNHPVISGVTDRTIIEGEVPDLLEGVSVDRSEDYYVNYSIDNEYQFVNSGAPGGRNETRNVVRNANFAEDIATLTPGVYNIYYTSTPKADDFAGRSRPKYPIDRKHAHLVVLPKGITATVGQTLSEVNLPEGWTWVSPTTRVEADKQYEVMYMNAADVTVEPEKRRTYLIQIDSNELMKSQPLSEEEQNTDSDNDKLVDSDKEKEDVVVTESDEEKENDTLTESDEDKEDVAIESDEETEEVEIQEDNDEIIEENSLKHNQSIIKQIPNKSNQLMNEDKEEKLDEVTSISETQLITQKDKEETSSTETQQEEKEEAPSTEKQQEDKEEAQQDKQSSTLQTTKTLPETGEQSQYLIFTAATLAILASVGLYSTSKKETDKQ